VSPHTQLAAAVLGAVLTAAAAAYYAWWRGRELHRVAALIPTTTAPPTGPADIPPTDDHGDPPQQPSARAYSLTGPRPRPPGAHRPPKEREA
jgi:hypothetical protein